MDPLTIALLAGSIGSGLYTGMSARGAADEALDFQRQRAAQQDRLARAGRTDAYGNRVSYDEALNEWITKLTPEQRALMLAQEREQRLSLTDDALRNRQARERLARAGEMAQPGFDEAMAGYRFGEPASEGSLRSEIAKLLSVSKAPRGSFDEIRGAERTPTFRGIQGEGPQDLAQTLMQARTQGLTESAARTGAHEAKYGPAIQRYLAMLGQGGGAPLASPTAGASTDATQNAMAQLMAQVGAQGSQAIGGAQKTQVDTYGKPLFDARGTAALITAMDKYTGGQDAGGGTGASSIARGAAGRARTGGGTVMNDPWDEEASAFNVYPGEGSFGRNYYF